MKKFLFTALLLILALGCSCVMAEECSHSGGEATCISLAVCDLCGDMYGDVDLTSSGHAYLVTENVPGTCYTPGKKTYVCQHSGCPDPVMVIETAAYGQHLYHDWEPTGEGSHVSPCRFCRKELTVPCSLFATEQFSVCPICGEYEGGVLTVILAHDDHKSLPHGTLVIYGGEVPVDGVLCAITVAGSYYGKLVEPRMPVTVSVPLELTGFRVVDMNGEEVPFSLKEGVLTFETATAGLFLLVPAE